MTDIVNKIAVLVDSSHVSTWQIDALLDKLSHMGDIISVRLYADWHGTANQHWQDWCVRAGVEYLHQRDRLQALHASAEDGDTPQDDVLVMDAIDLVHQEHDVDTVCIVAASAQYRSLVLRLKEYEVTVWGVGVAGSGALWAQACSQFIFLDEAPPAPMESSAQNVTVPAAPATPEVSVPVAASAAPAVSAPVVAPVTEPVAAPVVSVIPAAPEVSAPIAVVPEVPVIPVSTQPASSEIAYAPVQEPAVIDHGQQRQLDQASTPPQNARARNTAAVQHAVAQVQPNLEQLMPLEELLARAYALCAKEADGWVSSATLGQKMREVVHGVHVKHYGYLNMRAALGALSHLYELQAIDSNTAVYNVRPRHLQNAQELQQRVTTAAAASTLAAPAVALAQLLVHAYGQCSKDMNNGGWVSPMTLGASMAEIQPGAHVTQYGFPSMRAALKYFAGLFEMQSVPEEPMQYQIRQCGDLQAWLAGTPQQVEGSAVVAPSLTIDQVLSQAVDNASGRSKSGWVSIMAVASSIKAIKEQGGCDPQDFSFGFGQICGLFQKRPHQYVMMEDIGPRVAQDTNGQQSQFATGRDYRRLWVRKIRADEASMAQLPLGDLRTIMLQAWDLAAPQLPDKGWSSIKQFGMWVQAVRPGFDPRDHGYGSLGSVLMALAQDFEIQRQGTEVVLRKTEKEDNSGLMDGMRKLFGLGRS